MKKQYLLPAAFLITFGLAVYLFVYGYSFGGLVLMGIGAIFLAFGLIHVFRNRLPRLMKALRACLWVFVALLLTASFVTGYLIVSAGNGTPLRDEPGYLIVLGAGVNGTTPSRSLLERLTAAERFLKQHPNTIAVLSGGKVIVKIFPRHNVCSTG